MCLLLSSRPDKLPRRYSEGHDKHFLRFQVQPIAHRGIVWLCLHRVILVQLIR